MFCLERNRGFTLVEILVAIFILAIISVIMVSGLKSVLTAKEGLERNQHTLTELTTAMAYMQSDFTHVVNRSITNASGTTEPPLQLLSGSTQTVSLTRDNVDNPLAASRSDLLRVSYSISEGNLIRTTWPVLDPVHGTPSDNRILLTGITQASWQFIGDDARYYPGWPSNNGHVSPLPRGVVINLTTLQGSLSRVFAIAAQVPSNNTPSQN